MQTTKARLLGTFLLLAAATAFAATDYDNISAETGGLLSAAAYGRAIAQHEEAVRVAEQKTGEGSLQTAKAINSLASLFHDQGDYAKAEPLYQRSLSILESALDPDHPAIANCLNNLAMIYKAQGQYAKAEPLYRRSLAIEENALGAEHPDVAVSLNNLAQLYRSLGMSAKAEPLYQRSLAILEKTLGPRHPKTLTVRENMAPRSGKKVKVAETAPGKEDARTAALRKQPAGLAAAASPTPARAQAEAQSEAKALAEARAQVLAKAQADAEAKALAEAKAQAEAKALAEAKAQTLAKARAEVQAKALAEARSQAEKKALASSATAVAPAAGEMDQIALIDLAGAATAVVPSTPAPDVAKPLVVAIAPATVDHVQANALVEPAAVVAPALPTATVPPAVSVGAPIGGPVGDLVAASSDWVKSTPEKHYFIQLSASEPSERVALEGHLANALRQLDPKQVRAYRSALSGRDRIAIIYGEYATEAAGRDAIARLPPSFRKFQPFLRQVGKVR